MPRAVVFTLVAIQLLVPPGVCLRACGIPGWLSLATATPSPPSPNCLVEPTEKAHRAACCSACHDRAAQVREPAAPWESPARVCEDRTPRPTDQHSESDCWATCKAKSDKIAPYENPRAGGEVVSLGLVLADPVQVPRSRHCGPAVDFSPPPRYVTFCTFLF